MSEKIKRFIECIVPVTACNLRCHYCYVIQNNYRHNEIPKFNYSPSQIAYAMRKERMGGTCLINLCGAGETLLPKEVIPIAVALLQEGHYVNITTNGTIAERFKEIENIDKNLLSRLQLSCSLHYLELKKLNLIETYFENIKRVRDAGCSILVQFNMCDEYVPYLDEIKELCLKHIGALPHVAVTRDEYSEEIKIHSNLSREEYKKLGDEFNSELWDFTNKNFKVKRKEFCFAGDWSFRLDITTGEMKRCYFEGYSQNIFEDSEKPILTCPVGKKCKLQYCINSSHFMSLGIIPTIETPTYSELRDRICEDDTHWQTKEMSQFLSGKLYENNSTFDSTFFGQIGHFFKVLKFKSIKHKYKKMNNRQEFNSPERHVALERERERERERVTLLSNRENIVVKKIAA